MFLEEDICWASIQGGSSTAESEVSKSVAHRSPAAPPSLSWAQHTQPPMMRRIVVTIVNNVSHLTMRMILLIIMMIPTVTAIVMAI